MELPANIFVLFGATGDLANKKLIPALYRMHARGELHKDFRLFATGRRTISHTRLCKDYKEFVQKEVYQTKTWSDFCKRIEYHRLEFEDENAYDELLEKINKLKAKEHRIFYLATPQEAFATVVSNLARSGLAKKKPSKGWHRVVFEKPFGSDSKSAKTLNKGITHLFDEEQIYRIDHYIGKSLVQQILGLRFANPILENQWDRDHIESIEIAISEDVGVGSRGGYYDNSGAIRDMVQNHLMQVLSLVAMESPKSLYAEDIRDAKVAVLKKVELQTRAQLKHNLVLGQYTRGKTGKTNLPNYTDEKGISSESTTETYAAVKLFVNNHRWQGVPFYLWTGKALNDKFAEVRIKFKRGDWLQVPGCKGYIPENQFVIRIQPEEGLRMCINLAETKDTCAVAQEVLDFTKPTTYGLNTKEAYQLLLEEVMKGDQTMFTRWDFVCNSWRIADNLLSVNGQVHKYKAGSPGPFAALTLLKHNKRYLEK